MGTVSVRLSKSRNILASHLKSYVSNRKHTHKAESMILLRKKKPTEERNQTSVPSGLFLKKTNKPLPTASPSQSRDSWQRPYLWLIYIIEYEYPLEEYCKK